MLVGRELELRILTRSLGEASSNMGGVVLISGEPGIGKSSLLAELVLCAEAEGFRLVHARCAPRDLPGAGSPWLRIQDCLSTEFSEELALRPLSRNTSPTAQSGTSGDGSVLSGSTRHEMERLLEGIKPVPKLFIRLRELLEAASRPRPLLVTLDDLHHADELSLDLLLFLTHALHDSPVLVAAAYRPIDLSDHSIQRTIEAIKRNARNIEVMPLRENATGELLSRVLLRTPGASMVRRVHDLTGGNPLFILESEFVTDGQDSARSPETFREKVPSTVRVVIQERVKTLSSAARKLLGIASVIGTTFEPELAFRVLDFDREDARSSLFELEGGGLIRPANGRSYGFVQGFVRQVVYEEYATSENALLHRRIAAALEAQHAHDIEAYAGEIAGHLLKSRDARAMEKAVDYGELAGRRCAQAGEFAAASGMYAIALEAMNLHCCPDQVRLCDILIALGEAQKQAGEFRAAQETFCRAAESAQRLGDWRRIAQVSLDVPAFHWPLPGQSNVFAAVLADRALDSLAERDAAQRALVTARLAAELSYLRDERRRSEELAAKAMEIAQRLETDSRVMLQVLRFRDCVLRRPELIRDRLANGAEMTRVARQIGDWDALFEGAVTRAILRFQLGEIDGAEAEFEIAEQAAMMSNRPVYYALILATKAARAVYDGRLAKSEDLFAECRELATAQGLPELADRCWPAMVVPLREQGRLAELEPVAERSFMASPTSPVERAMLCWLTLEFDRTAEATFHLERLAADDFADLKYANGSLAGVAVLAEVCARLETAPHYAVSLYEFLLPYANSNIVLGQFAAFGAASYYLGKLAMTLSRCKEAIAHFEAAVDFNRKMGARTWTAYASVDLAKALLRLDKPDERSRAFEILRNANAEAESLGMESLARSSKELLESKGIERICNAAIHSVSPKITRVSANGSVGSPAEDPAQINTAPLLGQSVSRISEAFCREGEYWTLRYEGRVVRLKELKGMVWIAHLLSRPNQAVHVFELAPNGDIQEGRRESADLGPLLDAQAKQSYRERIRTLGEALEETRACGDTERAAKIEDERRFLTRELARAVGLLGRDRKSGSDIERTRIRVTNAIRSTVRKVAKHHPPLGLHLERTIKTGTICSYVPDSNNRPNWEL